MDRNSQNRYQGRGYPPESQHGQSTSYPWSTGNAGGSNQPYRGQSSTGHSSAPSPPQSSGANMYYNQAQVNYNSGPTSYGPGSSGSNQPYSNQQSYPQHQYGQSQGANMNPWGQYNQSQSFNSNAQSSANSTTQPHSYNQYQYPQAANQPTGQNSVNVSYPYYNAQQTANYYYPPNMYPAGIPPPPLPQVPPPPVQAIKLETSSSASDKLSDSSAKAPPRAEEKVKPSKPSQPSSEGSSSSKDKATSQQSSSNVVEEKEKEVKKAVPIMVGKRRGGRVLPTGVVKKAKVEDGNSKGKSDAWSQYMAEVRRYKDQSCTEERQNRPLVK